MPATFPTITEADYTDSAQAAAVVELLNGYAQTKEGGGEALDPVVQTHLVDRLAVIEGAFSLLAFDSVTESYVGLLNALPGFSTFAAKPLVNVHDIFVAPDYRGQGIARHLLHKTLEIARSRGCCKVTLEVLSGNHAARASYSKAGFKPYVLDDELGSAEFWQYSLS